jgi:hypothetical protein
MVVDGIRDLVISEVVKAGIGFIIGLLNPAGALIKIVKTIISIVQFFIQNGSRIVALIQAILGSLAAIAAGDSSGVAKKVEQALAGVIPIALGFLASLLGLGDLPAKIQGILDKIRAPINKAIDFVINLAVKVVKAAGKLVVGAFTPKKKDEKAEPEEADPKQAAKVAAAEAFIDQQEAAEGEDEEIDAESAQKVADAARARTDLFKSITVAPEGDFFAYTFTVNPSGKKKKTRRRKGKFPKTDIFFLPHDDWRNKFADRAKTMNYREDYIRQLQQQEAGINDMTVTDWKAGRKKFNNFKLTLKKKTGRDPASAAAQQEMREILEEQFVARLTASKGMLPGVARKAARKWLAKRAVLHDPDQVAAGEATTFNQLTVDQWLAQFQDQPEAEQAANLEELMLAFGLRAVNSSIGKQWVTQQEDGEMDEEANKEGPKKVEVIDAAVKAYKGSGDDNLFVKLHPDK